MARTQTGQEDVVMTAGRPTKCSKNMTVKFCEILAEGNYRSTACRSVGIAWHTFRRWMILGTKGQEPYATFLTSVKAAEADAEIARLRTITKAADEEGKWQAAAWQLERKYPEKWGRKDTLQASVNVKKELNLSGLTEKELLIIESLIMRQMKQNQDETETGAIEGEAEVLLPAVSSGEKE